MIDKDWVRELDQTIEGARDEFMGSLQSIVAMSNQVPLLELGQLTSPGESAFSGHHKGQPDLGNGFHDFIEARGALKKSGTPPLHLVSVTDPNDLLGYSMRCWYQRHVLRARFLDGAKSVHDAIVRVFQKDMGRRHMIADTRLLVEMHKLGFDQVILNRFKDCRQNAGSYTGDLKRKLNAGLDETIPVTVQEHIDLADTVLSQIWQLEDKKIKFTSVKENFGVWQLPFLVTNPISAHSGHFSSTFVHGLIARGYEPPK